MEQTSRWRLWGAGCAALWGLTVLLWLLDVSADGAPLWFNRMAVMAALAGSLAAGSLRASVVWRSSSPGDRLALALLALLVVVALAVRFVGLDHELAERFYKDEGYYTHYASRINGGQLLINTFNYPHLTYYLDAFLAWAASLFSGAALALAGLLWGVHDWPLFSRLLARSIPALCGALTAVPVFWLARRVGGLTAGLIAAAAITFSPLYNDGSHLAICDVPSAFFAACSLAAVGRLLERERIADYLWAGAFAGLAAGAKYPAGLVAAAIFAVWARWRWQQRRVLTPGLMWAALAALVVFLATTPSLVLLPEAAFSGQRSIFWGVAVHGGEGWVGVTPPSNNLYYLGLLGQSAGWPLLAAGVAGCLLLATERRRRLVWLLPFPVLYWVLIVTVSVAVPRNLHPLLPPLTLVAGVGVGELASRVERWDLPAGGRWATPTLLLLLLAWPVGRTVLQDVGFARPGTRVLAREWVREHVPRGAILLKEEYTPHFSEQEYAVRLPPGRFIGGMAMEEIVRPEIDLVIVSSGAFGRYFEAQRRTGSDYLRIQQRYREIRESFPLLARFEPGWARLGPTVELYRPLRPSPPLLTEMRFPVTYAFLPRKAMLQLEAGVIAFDRQGDWCQFKGLFRAGEYLLRILGGSDVGSTGHAGRLEVFDLENELLQREDLDAAGRTRVLLPEDGKYFFYLHLPSGVRIAGLDVRRR